MCAFDVMFYHATGDGSTRKKGSYSKLFYFVTEWAFFGITSLLRALLTGPRKPIFDASQGPNVFTCVP
jgi:hypothetical protein